ncbi:hypothetical protein SD81_008370 [Tolypothrix campylonemoides VB511288]|nr:hypothetical protein SD81_008370 [Tolypothrix campylonemoides VB511288]
MWFAGYGIVKTNSFLPVVGNQLLWCRPKDLLDLRRKHKTTQLTTTTLVDESIYRHSVFLTRTILSAKRSYLKAIA